MENVCSRLLNSNMKRDFEYLLGPSDEAIFLVHWPSVSQFVVQQLKTSEFADYFEGHWRGFLDPMDPKIMYINNITLFIVY